MDKLNNLKELLKVHNLSSVEYKEIIKVNPGRSFILPSQKKREEAVKRKFSFNLDEIKDKKILIVDDSIVRGTTSKHIIQRLKLGNPLDIYMASVSPPVKYRNIYGIDVPTETELVANNKNIEEISEYLDVKKIIYQDLNAMKNILINIFKESYQTEYIINDFECSMFDGIY